MEMLVDDRPDAAAESFANEIAAALRARRRSTGKTLNQVAAHCGTTPQTIQRLETGNMALTLTWMARICAALEIRPGDVLAPSVFDRQKVADCISAIKAAEADLRRTHAYLTLLHKEG